MKLRLFHKLDGADTGMDVYNNWLQSDKKPINDTDFSLIFNGSEYEDNSADFVAIGKVVIPCLTTDNLMFTCRQLNDTERDDISKSLYIPSKDQFIEWLQSPEAIEIIEGLGFRRTTKKNKKGESD